MLPCDKRESEKGIRADVSSKAGLRTLSLFPLVRVINNFPGVMILRKFPGKIFFLDEGKFVSMMSSNHVLLVKGLSKLWTAGKDEQGAVWSNYLTRCQT